MENNSKTSKIVASGYNEYFTPIYEPVDFIPVRGHGSRLYDKDNNELIDFAGGVAATGLGQTHPQLIATLKQQAEQLWHVGNIFTNEPQLELAKRFIDNTCFDKIFLCNCGTEAVETALKLARRYANKNYGTQKNQIVAFNQSYHGRTLFAVATGGQPKYWDGFAPLPQGIKHGVFNDCEALNTLITDDVAAVIIEPVQAEGGVIPANPQFLHKIRELCNQHNCALIFDEVQTGMGRSGDLFAYMGYGVEPDIIAIAKSIAGGFPMGATLIKHPFDSGFQFGLHGSTFGGNPLAAKVACTAFDIINDRQLLDGVKERAKVFVEQLTEINDELKIYKEIRGKGLLIGAQLADKYQGRAYEIVRLAPKFGVSVLNASPHVTRFLPSLIIPIEDITLGMKNLHQTLKHFLA